MGICGESKEPDWNRPIIPLPQRLSEMEGHPTRRKVFGIRRGDRA